MVSDKAVTEASAILDMILKSVDSFTAGCEQADDISVVVVRHAVESVRNELKEYA